jgi:hypothetical protein
MREYLNNTPETDEIFGSIFAGDDLTRGELKSWNKETGKKSVTHAKKKIDFSSHLRGEVIQGLSPVNQKWRGCKWMCFDIDEEIDPEIFCSKLWVYNRSLIPFKSLNGRWHVFKFYDDWQSVEDIKEEAKEIERDLIELGFAVDKTHTLPTGWSFDRKSSGSWIFLPYADENVCYSPKGNPLNISQFIYRYRVRNHPLIAGLVGMNEKQGGRPKAMFNACLYMHHYEVDTSPEELNLHLGKQLSEKDLENAKGVEEYSKDYLKRNFNNYLSELCNDEFPFDKNEKLEEEKPKRKKGLTTFNFQDFTARSYPSTKYYLYPFMSSESVSLGWSLPGVGKTLFTFDACYHCSQGKNFLDWNHSCPDDPPPFLYVEFEMSSKQLQNRALEIAERENFKYKPENFRIATLGDQPHGQYRMLTTKEGREDIEVTAKEILEETGKHPIIVIDNIRFAMGDFDEKEGKDWIPFVLWCAQMRSQGYSIIYLHHATNTGEKFSGSGYGNSNVNLEFALRIPKDDEMHPDYDIDNYTQFVFQFKKMRENVVGALTPFLVVTCKKTHKWFKFPILSKTERAVAKELSLGKKVDQIISENKDKDGFSRANVFRVKKKIGIKDELSEHY